MNKRQRRKYCRIMSPAKVELLNQSLTTEHELVDSVVALSAIEWDVALALAMAGAAQQLERADTSTKKANLLQSIQGLKTVVSCRAAMIAARDKFEQEPR